MEYKIDMPEGVEFLVEGQNITAKGPAGEVTRIFPTSRLAISVADNKVVLKTKFENAKTRALIGTFRAHVKNMLRGAQEPFVYKLVAASVHFPMNLALAGNKLTISNFLGSKKPRFVTIPNGVELKVAGKELTVTSPNIELAGMTVTKLEQITRLSNKDRRVFQDGIFLTERAGKKI